MPSPLTCLVGLVPGVFHMGLGIKFMSSCLQELYPLNYLGALDLLLRFAFPSSQGLSE